MAAKFGQLKALGADAGVRRFDLYSIIGMEGAVLFGKPATRRLNPPYQNAIMRVGMRMQRAMRGDNTRIQAVNAFKDATKKPFADHVLTGWEGVVDETGKEVPFSAENALDFLSALPDSLFDEIQAYFENDFSTQDGEEPAKNSKTS
jgi:hypothetical protein